MKLLYLLSLILATQTLSVPTTPTDVNFYGSKLQISPSRHCNILTLQKVQPDRLLNPDSPIITASKYKKDQEIDDIFEFTFLDTSIQTKAFTRKIQQLCENNQEIVRIVYENIYEKQGLVFQNGYKHVIDDSKDEFIDDVVLKIIDSGDPANRIDVVFMGDGYTASEQDKFFADITRLADEMWTGSTFYTVRPLVNVWAVFRPSVDSGIGTGGKPKNTAFGLYRDGNELRGIYCSKKKAARNICRKMGVSCEFPSLIANDDYYGGLGGEFTISTRSILSGTVVLRHELGHNFINVGEEYDNGQVYSGVNSSPSLNVKWKHWVSDVPVVEQKQVIRLAKYPWYDLSEGPIEFGFKSDGKQSKWLLKLSSSGTSQPNSLELYLDSQKLAWTPRGDNDRAFYTWEGNGFSPGSHFLKIQTSGNSTDGPIKQLCSFTLHEYDASFIHNNSFIGAYPTWDLDGRKTYRPTNEGCLMREMSSTSFCSPCLEGMWLRFLQRVTLIDSLTTRCSDSKVHIKLAILPLAQFREYRESKIDEKYTIKWYNGEKKLMREFNDHLEINVDASQEIWRVDVHFTSNEIRKDTKGLTKSSKKFRLMC